jgi:hypothetical protein
MLMSAEQVHRLAPRERDEGLDGIRRTGDQGGERALLLPVVDGIPSRAEKQLLAARTGAKLNNLLWQCRTISEMHSRFSPRRGSKGTIRSVRLDTGGPGVNLDWYVGPHVSPP